MNSDQSKDRSIPFALIATTIIAYALLLPEMGFYWDDWPFVWIAKFLGPADFVPAFANVRPFVGHIFYLTTSLIPPEPIYWQVLMLVIRFLTGLLAWSIFSQVWPQHRQQALVAAILFLVFPGYSQHWVAFTHINQEWIPFLFYLLSFSFTARALRNPRNFRSNTLFALLFLIPGVFPTEYFIGIEPLRLLFIWVIVSETSTGLRESMKSSLKLWAPYLLIWLANAAWLAYFYTIGSYGSYDVEIVNEPVTFLHVITAIGDAIWKAGFYIWVQVGVLIAQAPQAPSSLLTLALIAISFVVILFYLRHFDAYANARRFAFSALVIGVVGILLGRLPSFAAGLLLKLQAVNDRFMISMMIGGSLFIVGLLELVIRNARTRLVVYSLLIAFGVGQQFFNANIFRRDWASQQQFFWQLAWRIPAMQPNTLLLTDQLPVDNETDLSFTAPINWIYAPTYTRSIIPYALVYTEKRLGGTLPSFQPGEKINVYLRTAYFEGSTSQAIVIHMPKGGCLRVLGSRWDDQETYARQSGYLLKAIPLSNPDLILFDDEKTARLPFLSEPEHSWCYYYTKAELARQQNNWQRVIDLWSEATSLGYEANDPLEWLVFIEAEAMMGNLETAEKRSMDAMEWDPGVRKGLCQIWKRVQASGPAGDGLQSHAQQLRADLRCPP